MTHKQVHHNNVSLDDYTIDTRLTNQLNLTGPKRGHRRLATVSQTRLKSPGIESKVRPISTLMTAIITALYPFYDTWGRRQTFSERYRQSRLCQHVTTDLYMHWDGLFNWTQTTLSPTSGVMSFALVLQNNFISLTIWVWDGGSPCDCNTLRWP